MRHNEILWAWRSGAVIGTALIASGMLVFFIASRGGEAEDHTSNDHFTQIIPAPLDEPEAVPFYREEEISLTPERNDLTTSGSPDTPEAISLQDLMRAGDKLRSSLPGIANDVSDSLGLSKSGIEGLREKMNSEGARIQSRAARALQVEAARAAREIGPALTDMGNADEIGSAEVIGIIDTLSSSSRSFTGRFFGSREDEK